MIKTTRPLRYVATALMLFLVLFLSVIPRTAWATAPDVEDTIELTGTSSGTFELNSSDTELFALKNIAPGDSWSGRLNVVNKTDGEMHLSLISITSNLEDNLLYDTLELEIYLDGALLYEGSYGATRTPLVEWLPVPSDEPVVFDIYVELPSSAGNALQGKEMDSTWLFEAYYEPDDTIQTGIDLTVSNSGNATWLVVSGLCLACCVILFFRVKAVKRQLEQQYSTDKEENTYGE